MVNRINAYSDCLLPIYAEPTHQFTIIYYIPHYGTAMALEYNHCLHSMPSILLISKRIEEFFLFFFRFQ